MVFLILDKNSQKIRKMKMLISGVHNSACSFSVHHILETCSCVAEQISLCCFVFEVLFVSQVIPHTK